MFFSRVALVALSVFGMVQAMPTPSPIAKNVAISRATNDTGVDGTDAIMSVLTTLKGQTDTILPQIDTLAKRTDENVDPLFDELIAALTAAQESLAGIDAQGVVASTDNLNEVGAVIADTIKGISATLDASSVSVSLIGTIALLLFNLLVALNVLLPGILIVIIALLGGIVGIVITLLLTLLGILIL